MRLNYDELYCIAEQCNFATRLALGDAVGCIFKKPNKLMKNQTAPIEELLEKITNSRMRLWYRPMEAWKWTVVGKINRIADQRVRAQTMLMFPGLEIT